MGPAESRAISAVIITKARKLGFRCARSTAGQRLSENFHRGLTKALSTAGRWRAEPIERAGSAPIWLQAPQATSGRLDKIGNAEPREAGNGGRYEDALTMKHANVRGACLALCSRCRRRSVTFILSTELSIWGCVVADIVHSNHVADGLSMLLGPERLLRRSLAGFWSSIHPLKLA